MPNIQEPKDDITLKDYLDVSVWAFKLLYKVLPGLTVTFLIADTFYTLIPILNAYITAKLLDQVVSLVSQGSGSVKDVLPFLGALLAAHIIRNIFGATRNISRNGISIKSNRLLRRELYFHIQGLGIQTLEGTEINNKLVRARDSTNELANFTRGNINMLTLLISFIISAGILAFHIPIVIPVVIVFTIPGLLYDKKYRSLVWRFSTEMTEENRKAWNIPATLTEGESLYEIFITNAKHYLDRKFMAIVGPFMDKMFGLHKRWLSGVWGLGILTRFGDYIGYVIIIAKVISGQFSIGDMTFLFRITEDLSGDLEYFAGEFSSVFEHSLRFQDMYVLFNTKNEIPDGNTDIGTLNKGPSIEINDLVFTYPKGSSPTILGLDLKIKSGEKVAIVGHNGAGKTTLVKLISRMYSPDSGEILINGTDLRDIKTESWYENLGVLFQEFNRYQMLTVKENIEIGLPNQKLNEEKMVDALERADALDFVNDLPNKLDQLLGERYKGGIKLSTGQWQKLAIARFFYRNAPLVIFDEPTAAIDAVSEYNIFNKIYSFFENKTVIIISHRFSTVRNADRIIVLEKGKILEEGTHLELMEKDGYYAQSFRLQAEGYSDSTTSIA